MFEPRIIKKTLRLLLFAGLVAACMALLARAGSPWLHPLAWWVLLAFVLLAVATQLLGGWVARHHAGQLHLYFLAGVVVRMVVTVGLAFWFIARGTPRVELLVGNFFVLYVALLAFEIMAALGNLRHDSKRSPS